MHYCIIQVWRRSPQQKWGRAQTPPAHSQFLGIKWAFPNSTGYCQFLKPPRPGSFSRQSPWVPCLSSAPVPTRDTGSQRGSAATCRTQRELQPRHQRGYRTGHGDTGTGLGTAVTGTGLGTAVTLSQAPNPGTDGPLSHTRNRIFIHKRQGSTVQ